MESVIEETAPTPAAAVLPQPVSKLSLATTPNTIDNGHAEDISSAKAGLAGDNQLHEDHKVNEIQSSQDGGDKGTLTLQNGHLEHTAPSPINSPAPSSKSSRPVSGIIPPFWQRHERTVSRASLSSIAQSRIIRLEDHTADPNSETSRGLWAKSVAIDDHVVVQGKSGIGSYVVWNCTVQTLDGGPIVVRLRISTDLQLDTLNLMTFGKDLHQPFLMPEMHYRRFLPRVYYKINISSDTTVKFRPKFLETRRVGLEYFLNCVLLNPEFSSSPIVKDFLFGRSS
ncbi:hypothetical protein N7539_008192 [Penicillium diatomitis]|uniref:Endosomal/vacuolar adapter protein YPT35 n=1 Tax=Penicillium diatomitis TaxID=2819901 RepID=A0A9W9WTK4_9EURO|nr:uncharacterized protein N7539_008192 [Penicillium diatomitis]KAJ5475126.1 hypothetical protein N7539_008192 [Penicillium diatomitis]